MRKNIKVLVISTVEISSNGIASCILNYFNKIASDGVKMDILAPNIVKGEIRELIADKKMKLYELPFRNRNPLKYVISLIKIVRKEKYDIVHVHGNSCTMTIELFAAMIAGCRVRIAHSHNTTCDHIKVHKILRPLFELSCTERFACGNEAGSWLFRNKKFSVIKNGVDLEKYQYDKNIRNKVRQNLQVEENQILLGHVGLFNYQKNHEFLINLMKNLKENEKFKLVLLGDGEVKKEIEQMIVQFGLEKKIMMLGVVSEVSSYLQAMDCMLLPSRYEGLPYVLVEAQANGLPSLVSENVSREADMIKNMSFLKLEIDEWLHQIFNNEKVFIRKSSEEVKSAFDIYGYNLTMNAQTLKEKYLSLCEDIKR